MLGLDFTVQAADIAEAVAPGLPPEETVMSLAAQKAAAVKGCMGDSQRTIVGADTVVFFQNRIFGKTKSFQEAFSMLSALSGNTHQVYTGVCILSAKGQESLFFERTDVTFFPLTQEEIWNYIHEEKPFDKAGSYGIQGKAAVFVEKIQGDFFNVVGFPAARFIRKLRTLEKGKGIFPKRSERVRGCCPVKRLKRCFVSAARTWLLMRRRFGGGAVESTHRPF